MTKNVAFLMLAAGSSTRMGKNMKQLLPWGEGTLLGHALYEARKSSAQEVFLVLGANAESIKNQVPMKGVHCIINPNWQSGMGSSISAGITEIMKTKKNFGGVLIGLADQPFLDATYFDSLIGELQNSESGIIATQYENRAGVPAIFEKSYFSVLQALKGDQGAKVVLSQNRVTTINAFGKAVDIDTYETYVQLLDKIETKNI